MENFFPFHNIDDFENMMINILNEGESVTWNLIDDEKDAFKRIKKRKMYWKAIQKINKDK